MLRNEGQPGGGGQRHGDQDGESRVLAGPDVPRPGVPGRPRGNVQHREHDNVVDVGAGEKHHGGQHDRENLARRHRCLQQGTALTLSLLSGGPSRRPRNCCILTVWTIPLTARHCGSCSREGCCPIAPVTRSSTSNGSCWRSPPRSKGTPGDICTASRCPTPACSPSPRPPASRS